ncbi:MAG: MarR family transcriptional regulator [Thermotogota bacterium]|nr:MarR family transcriptional regulator [Thermotogota bacterium]
MEKYEELEKLMRKISAWIKAEGRMALKEGDNEITPAQFDVLQSIYWHENLTMTSISKRLGVAKSTVTGLVNKLKDEKLVDYKVSDEDRRVRRLKITKHGEEVIKEVIKRRITFVEKMFSTIDPYLVDEFRQVLRIVVKTCDERKI